MEAADSGVVPEEISAVRRASVQYRGKGGLSGAGNVICRAGTARTGAGLGRWAHPAASAADREIGAAENPFDFLRIAMGAFHLGRIVCAGK